MATKSVKAGQAKTDNSKGGSDKTELPISSVSVQTVDEAEKDSAPAAMSQKQSKMLEEIDSFLESEDNLPTKLEKGGIVKGKVVRVREGEILVDVGAKAEGVVSGRELKSKEEDFSGLKKGDEILVFVVNPEDEDGQLVLSLRRTSEARRWLFLKEAKAKNDIIEVEVIEANSGGVIVDTGGGLRGFIPTSQLDPKRVYPDSRKVTTKDVSHSVQERLSSLIGQKIKVRIIEIDREKNRVILSEKLVTQERDLKLRDDTLAKAKVGDVLQGEVSGITPFGVFVNAQGLEGLVHLSEISWDKVDDPADFCKIGEKVKVQIIGIDEDGKRVAYSMKRLEKDPWADAIASFKVGDVVKGKVTKIVDYGAFVRIGRGLNGLVHISELSNDLILDPKEVVQEGKEYELKILSISKTERHLGLSLKRVREGEEAKNKDEEIK